MLHSAVTIYRDIQFLASNFPGRRICVAGGKTAAGNMICVFAYLFNFVPLDVKMAFLDEERPVVKGACTCPQIYFNSGTRKPILARCEARITPGHSFHGLCVEVNSICPQRLIPPGYHNVTPGTVSPDCVIVIQRISLDPNWKTGTSPS